MSTVVSMRLPDALLRDAKKTVKLGHYTSLNELVVSGIRQQLYRFMEPPAVAEVRRARREMTERFLPAAGGDWGKAEELEAEYLMKKEDELKLIRPEYFEAQPLSRMAKAAVPGDKRRARRLAH